MPPLRPRLQPQHRDLTRGHVALRKISRARPAIIGGAMHESSLIPELIAKITALASENGSQRVTDIEITIGALTGMDADHLREHFVSAAAGTVAEGAEIRCRISEDPLSSAIILESLELEQ